MELPLVLIEELLGRARRCERQLDALAQTLAEGEVVQVGTSLIERADREVERPLSGSKRKDMPRDARPEIGR